MPDQRGHGASGVPERFTLDAFALDAIDLLDRLQIERAIIVGHSLGSFVARRMAALKAESPSRWTVEQRDGLGRRVDIGA